MQQKLLLAIDQGTTGTTCLLVNAKLEIVGRFSHEILPAYPRPGWVDHDLNLIWDGTAHAIRKVLDLTGVSGSQIAAIGITNQRETVGAWNPKTMVPYGPAIVWQCRRTSQQTKELRDSGYEDLVRERTGLVLDPYFSASKINWLLKNTPGLSEKAEKGLAVFGTIDTFLLHRLTLGETIATDVTNASRMSLMNLKTQAWDEEMIELFGVPKAPLPEIKPSAGLFGKTKGLAFLPDGIPISGILGDQQAALLGQFCFTAGNAKITYGTGCFLVTNTGEHIVYSKHQLLTTVAWKIFDKTIYALEGSAFMGGATVQWLRDGLGLIRSASEIEALARSADRSEMGDLTLVPAMTGLGAPHWDPEARGILSGITRGTNRAQIALAALDGIAHQNDELLQAMAQDLGKPLRSIRVDGGAAANDLLLQIQCDLAQTELVRPKNLETTAIGAAIAAGIGIGWWKSFAELEQIQTSDKVFTPAISERELKERRQRWTKAISRCRLN